jgi:hypothetical protein
VRQNLHAHARIGHASGAITVSYTKPSASQ